MICKQNGCTNEAAYRYTWPGKDESVICEAHVGKLRSVANAIGMHLQVVPLPLVVVVVDDRTPEPTP